MTRNIFTSFSVNPLSAIELAGLGFWIDASDSSNITTVGGNVTAMNDKSGGGVGWTIVNNGTIPLLQNQAGPTGTMPLMQFSGTSTCYLKCTSATSVLSNYLVLAVIKSIVPNYTSYGYPAPATFGAGATALKNRPSIIQDPSVFGQGAHAPLEMFSQAGAPGPAITTMAGAQVDSTGVSYTMGNRNLNTTNNGDMSPMTNLFVCSINTSALTLATNTFNIGQYWNGYIGEILVYGGGAFNHPVNQGTVTAAVTFLINKWGIT